MVSHYYGSTTYFTHALHCLMLQHVNMLHMHCVYLVICYLTFNCVYISKQVVLSLDLLILNEI